MVNRKPIRLWVGGRNACFTRPEMKAERVSYDVMTPSAARGVLEAVLWKPAMRWTILQIDVLKPVRWESVRRNEVGAVASTAKANQLSRQTTGNWGIDIEDERQQRAGLFLRDVAYVVHASVALTDRAGPEDNETKFEQMFLRRAEAGQCFHRPYLGCREFPADFELIDAEAEGPAPIPESRDLGWMLHDFDFAQSPPAPLFFRAQLDEGRIDLRDVEVFA